MAANIPPKKKPKLHKERGRSSKFKAVANLRGKLFEMFDEIHMNRAHAKDFLLHCLRELEYECNPAPVDTVNLHDAIQEQYDSLNQSQKRTLIPLLTHKDGAVNEDVLQCLPFLEARSRNLFASPVRKTRDDKIELTFISDFMHDHCRYVIISFIVIYINVLALILDYWVQIKYIWCQSCCWV